MTMPTDDGKSHEDQGGILGEAQEKGPGKWLQENG
jgi:hypothetical protein